MGNNAPNIHELTLMISGRQPLYAIHFVPIPVTYPFT
jgi:hypothetical protein